MNARVEFFVAVGVMTTAILFALLMGMGFVGMLELVRVLRSRKASK